MALSEKQKHLLEAAALIGGGALLWWLLSGDGDVELGSTYPPDLGFGGSATPNSGITLNYPGSGPITFPGVGDVDIDLGSSPFNVTTGDLDIPPLTFPGILGSGNTSPDADCGCCSAPGASGNAFASPEQAVAIIARVNPYGFQIGNLPAHAAQTQSGYIIPDGALVYSPGQEVPVEDIASIPGGSFGSLSDFAAAAGYG